MDDGEYEKYKIELSRKIAFKNTKEILENCLNIKKEINEIKKMRNMIAITLFVF